MENQEQVFTFSIKKAELSSFSELFKRTWQIYKERFWTFLGIMVIPFLFFLFAGLSSLFLKFSDWIIALVIFLLIISFIFLIWAEVALLYAIKDRELKIGIKESFKKAKSKILSYIWISFLTGFIVLGGVFLLLIPGIIFSLWFSLSLYILVAEDQKGFSALWRSKQLVKGYWWPVFWRFLLIGLIFGGIGLLLGLISGDNFFLKIVYEIFIILTIPFNFTFYFLIYEELKKIKEGIPFEAPETKTKLGFILIGILGFLFIPVTFLLLF